MAKVSVKPSDETDTCWEIVFLPTDYGDKPTASRDILKKMIKSGSVSGDYLQRAQLPQYGVDPKVIEAYEKKIAMLEEEVERQKQIISDMEKRQQQEKDNGMK